MDPVAVLQSTLAGSMARIVDLLPLGYAFGAGMMSAVNPCGFALLPTYLALFLGAGEETFREQPAAVRLGRAFGVAAVVSMGFILLFAAVGAVVAAGARVVISAMPWISLAMGIGLVILGLWLLAGRCLSGDLLLRWGTRLGGSRVVGIRGYFLYGLTFGFCSVSCTLPIFLVVVGSAVAAGGIWSGLGQFVSYGFGMGAVVTAMTLAAAMVKEGMVVARVRRILPYLQPATAIFVMLAGIYIVYYWLIKGALLA